MRLSILFALLACTLALAATVGASYLEEVPDPEPAVVRPNTVPDNPLTRLVQRASVRPWYSHRGLTVFRIELPEVEDDTLYLSLEEALEAGALVITEKDAGSVPMLLARNKGKRPVLMLGGEIVVGGKQNRTLRDDLLVPPHSDTVELPVYCVEQGRWSGGSNSFSSKSSLAAHNVRAAAIAKASQQEVWASVEHYRRNLSVAAETTDLQSVQDDSEVQRKLAEYIPGEVLHKHRQAFGMVVARGERIVGADIFCNPAVFTKHRRRLLESYALDCLAVDRQKPVREFRRPTPGEAERFLRRVLGARFSWRSTPGDGRLLDIEARACRGTALVHGDAVIHATIVPWRPRPAPVRLLPRQLEAQ
jgi:hypothetical protein